MVENKTEEQQSEGKTVLEADASVFLSELSAKTANSHFDKARLSEENQ
ncbi:hypothetical protein ACU063_11110 [Paenibacillus sp. M.A.Huq-81]